MADSWETILERAATDSGYCPEQSAAELLPDGLADLAAELLLDEPDEALADLVAALGFDARPEIVSSAELNAHAQSGERELWRAVDTIDQAQDLMTGAAPFVGRCGVCTGVGRRGRRYVETTHWAFTRIRPELSETPVDVELGVMRMTLRHDARVALWARVVRDARREAESLREVATGCGETEALLFRAEAALYDSPFRWAVARGIDAVLRRHQRFLELNVLNRGALRIQRQLVAVDPAKILEMQACLERAITAASSAPLTLTNAQTTPSPSRRSPGA